MTKYHEEGIRDYLNGAFGFSGHISKSVEEIVKLFENLGVNMHFNGKFDGVTIPEIPIETTLTGQVVLNLI